MLSFANATSNYFNRLGKLGALIANIKSYQTTQQIAMVDPSLGVTAQLNTEPDIQAIMGSSYIGLLTGPESAAGTAQQIAQAVTNRMVFRDNAQFGQTLQQGNLLTSINEVIRQMYAQGATILAMSVTATPSSFVGNGNGIVVASVRRPLDGLVLENSFAEVGVVRCTIDSNSGGAIAGNEFMQALGDGAETDLFAFDWPLGSNGSVSFNAINGDTDAGQGNILTNSSFNNWTANVPNNWNLIIGVAGTDILKESSLTYSGGGSIHFVGDGTTLTQIRQTFNNSNGTPLSLSRQTQYSANFFLRSGVSPPAAGVLTVDLVDVNLTVINDVAGNPNTFDIDLTGLNTVYTAYNGVFRTPAIMPTTMYIRLRLSTPITSGASVYIDKGSLGAMNQWYTGGPFLAVHSGSVPFLIGDQANVTVANSRGAGGTLATWQTALYRLLAPVSIQNEILWPSSNVPNVSDNLL